MKTHRCSSELLHKDLSGRTYIVTGANSGIGLSTARQLAAQGAHVVAACRRPEPGRKMLGSAVGSVEVMQLDLSSLASVREFANTFKSRHSRLHGLINNAGVMHTPEGRTEDGFETQFGTNHLGHFLLTELLLDTLKASAPSRIVCVSSVLHVGSKKIPGTIDLDDPNFNKRTYDREVAYTQSKLANVLHALELSKRLEGCEVTAYSVHPGWVRSNLAQHVMPVWIQNVLMRPFAGLLGLISPEDGAQTTLYCLLAAKLNNGAYYSQHGILYPKKEDRAGGWPMISPNPNALDADLAAKLYDRSLTWVGLA